MIIALLSLCLSAGRLTPHEISNAEVDTLNVSQLENEDWRLSDKPSYAGWATMLGIGVPVAAAGTVFSYLAIDATNRAWGWSRLAWYVIDFFAVVVAVAGYGLTIGGGVMLPITAWRRGKYEARQALVRARLAAIESGQLEAPPEPDLELARWELKVTRLQARRPGLGLPIGLMGGGLGAGVYGAYQLASRTVPGSDGVFTLAVGIAFICAGVALEGVGAYFLIDRLRQRQEIDRELAGLLDAPPAEQLPPPPPPPASRLPSAPVFFSYTWPL